MVTTVYIYLATLEKSEDARECYGHSVYSVLVQGIKNTLVRLSDDHCRMNDDLSNFPTEASRFIQDKWQYGKYLGTYRQNPLPSVRLLMNINPLSA